MAFSWRMIIVIFYEITRIIAQAMVWFDYMLLYLHRIVQIYLMRIDMPIANDYQGKIEYNILPRTNTVTQRFPKSTIIILTIVAYVYLLGFEMRHSMRFSTSFNNFFLLMPSQTLRMLQNCRATNLFYE